MVREVVAANLRRIRVAAGLSASELAQATGLAKATVWAIENGGANPRLDTLAALAEALRVDVAALLAPLPVPAVEVVRAGRGERGKVAGVTVQALAGGTTMVEVPARHEQELPAERDRARVVYVLDGRLETGPVEAPTELGVGDSAAFSAASPTLLRTGARRAHALVLLTGAG